MKCLILFQKNWTLMVTNVIFWKTISNFQSIMGKNMPKNSIQSMMITKILIKKKKNDFLNKKLNMLPIH